MKRFTSRELIKWTASCRILFGFLEVYNYHRTLPYHRMMLQMYEADGRYYTGD